jgi:peptidoglycan/xylan/chitin deacetylase (PgdA/CDA1 family)
MAGPSGIRTKPATMPLARLVLLVSCVLLLFSIASTGAAADRRAQQPIPILVYHRFGPAVADRMTVTTAVFESQLRYLRDNGYTVVTLKRLLATWRDEGERLPERAVVITADDGHASVYTYMFPLLQRYGMPVTLFVYPSVISNAPYAMTWAQLEELVRSGSVDIQSHTYWHPNFRQEQRRLSPEAYRQFVRTQLLRSRQTLDGHLGARVELLAWPFGIYDPELVGYAREAGYVAAVTLEGRHARAVDPPYALPRYLITDSDRGATFARLLETSSPRPLVTRPKP